MVSVTDEAGRHEGSVTVAVAAALLPLVIIVAVLVFFLG